MQLTDVQYQAIMEAIDQYKTNTDPTISDMGAEFDNGEKLAAIYEVEEMLIKHSLSLKCESCDRPAIGYYENALTCEVHMPTQNLLVR